MASIQCELAKFHQGESTHKKSLWPGCEWWISDRNLVSCDFFDVWVSSFLSLPVFFPIFDFKENIPHDMKMAPPTNLSKFIQIQGCPNRVKYNVGCGLKLTPAQIGLVRPGDPQACGETSCPVAWIQLSQFLARIGIFPEWHTKLNWWKTRVNKKFCVPKIGHTRGFMSTRVVWLETPKKSTRNGEFWKITGNVEPLFDQSLFATFAGSSFLLQKGWWSWHFSRLYKIPWTHLGLWRWCFSFPRW